MFELDITILRFSLHLFSLLAVLNFLLWNTNVDVKKQKSTTRDQSVNSIHEKENELPPQKDDSTRKSCLNLQDQDLSTYQNETGKKDFEQLALQLYDSKKEVLQLQKKLEQSQATHLSKETVLQKRLIDSFKQIRSLRTSTRAGFSNDNDNDENGRKQLDKKEGKKKEDEIMYLKEQLETSQKVKEQILKEKEALEQANMVLTEQFKKLTIQSESRQQTIYDQSNEKQLMCQSKEAEISKLQEQLKTFVNTNNELLQERAELEEANRVLTDQIKAELQEKETKQHTLAEQMRKEKDLINARKTEKEETERLKDQLAMLEKSNHELLETKDDVEQMNNLIADQLKTAQQMLSEQTKKEQQLILQSKMEMDQEISSLKQQLEILQKSNNELLEMKVKVDEANVSLVDQVKMLSKKKNTAQQMLLNQMEKEKDLTALSQMEGKVLDLKGQVQSLQKTNNELFKDKQKIEERNDMLTDQVNTVSKEIEAKRQMLADHTEKVKQLMTHQSKMRLEKEKELLNLKGQLETLQKSNIDLLEEKEKVLQANIALVDQVEQASKQIQSKEEMVTIEMEEQRRLLNQNAREKEKEIMCLKERIEKLQETNTELKANQEFAEHLKTLSRDGMKELMSTSQVEEQRQLDIQSTTGKKKDIVILKEQIESLRKSNTELLQEKEEVESINKNVAEQLKTISYTCNKTKQMLAEQKKKEKELIHRSEKEKSEMKYLKEQLENLQEKNEELIQEKEKVKHTNEELAKQMKTACEENQVKEQMLADQIEMDRRLMHESNLDKEKSISKLEEKLDAFKKTNNDVLYEKEQAQKANMALANLVSRKDVEILKLEEQLAQYESRGSLADGKGEIANLLEKKKSVGLLEKEIAEIANMIERKMGESSSNVDKYPLTAFTNVDETDPVSESNADGSMTISEITWNSEWSLPTPVGEVGQDSENNTLNQIKKRRSVQQLEKKIGEISDLINKKTTSMSIPLSANEPVPISEITWQRAD